MGSESASAESAAQRGYSLGAVRTVKRPSQTVVEAKKRCQEAIRRAKLRRATGTGWPA